MAFQFGFHAEESDDNEEPQLQSTTIQSEPRPDDQASIKIQDPTPVQEHILEDLLGTLPETISYTVVRIPSAGNPDVLVSRRDLFDVRVQLLQEGSVNDTVIDQLDTSDIRTGVYEGGFKTWECSLDLANYLLGQECHDATPESMRYDHVVELGAGTAFPTLIMLRHALTFSLPVTFTLADYNETVLRLVTLPNILLTWATLQKGESNNTGQDDKRIGELEITPALVGEFVADLRQKRIGLKFLSGPWSNPLSVMIASSTLEKGTLLLGSETIYSLASTHAFVLSLVELLGRLKHVKALVAAKRIYFGVGGSVDGFKDTCARFGMKAVEINDHGVVGMIRPGVERVILEVRMSPDRLLCTG